jgi:hypothetical protein
MMKKRIALFLVLTVALAGWSQMALACTIFNAAGNGMILVGNNEDHEDPNGEVRFEPASEGKYGKITFAFGPFTQGGMNEQGLFFDFYASGDYRMSPLLPGQVLPSGEVPDKEPTLDEMIAVYTQYDVASKKMLETCATVEEAIGFYQMNYEGTLGYGYLMVADKTGASATVTWDWDQNQIRVTRKSASFQVIGVGSKYIYPRINTGNDEVSVDYFRDLLKNTSRDDTAYSNIYNLKQGLIYVYNQHNFDKVVQFDLMQELAKGEHSFFLKDLF